MGTEDRAIKISNWELDWHIAKVHASAKVGKDSYIGDYVLIREGVSIGKNCIIGSHVVIEPFCVIGDNCSIQSGAYIASHTHIKNKVFIGPKAVLLNDKYPQRNRKHYNPCGPFVLDGASIGSGAILLPGIRIGVGAMVGAGAVVTQDVNDWNLAIGVPARCEALPAHLLEMNRKKEWADG